MILSYLLVDVTFLVFLLVYLLMFVMCCKSWLSFVLTTYVVFWCQLSEQSCLGRIPDH